MLLSWATQHSWAKQHRAMQHKLATFFFCFLLMLANQCRAWSETGHIIIAELAQKNLPDQTRSRLQEYANVLLAGAPKSGNLWRKRYPDYSALAYTAAWPDTIRGLTLEELFRHYGTTVPPELRHYKDKTTNNWHYTNRWYYIKQGYGKQLTETPKHCGKVAYRFNNNGELLAVLERLNTGFKNAESEAQRAVMLAFLIHLLSDLHQPLHNFAGVTRDCKNDRGGSGFCVDRHSPGKCELNLHQWWDRGVGLFKSPADLKRTEMWIAGGGINSANTLLAAEPVLAPTLVPAQLKAWSDESRAYTTSVYALEEGSMPDSHYVAGAQAIVKKQTVAAVERLRAILLTLTD